MRGVKYTMAFLCYEYISRFNFEKMHILTWIYLNLKSLKWTDVTTEEQQ